MTVPRFCVRCRVIGYRLTVFTLRWPRLHRWLVDCKCEPIDLRPLQTHE